MTVVPVVTGMGEVTVVTVVIVVTVVTEETVVTIFYFFRMCFFYTLSYLCGSRPGQKPKNQKIRPELGPFLLFGILNKKML